MEGKTIAESAITMAQVMQPNQANAAGNVHGGEIMMMMDNAAGVVATRHARSNTVTARVESINFYKRIYVGNLVRVAARLDFVGKHSMEVEIEVIAEDLITGDHSHALTAYFIMVATDRQGNVAEVPPLIVETAEQRQRFEEGRQRYEERRRNRTM